MRFCPLKTVLAFTIFHISKIKGLSAAAESWCTREKGQISLKDASFLDNVVR